MQHERPAEDLLAVGRAYSRSADVEDEHRRRGVAADYSEVRGQAEEEEAPAAAAVGQVERRHVLHHMGQFSWCHGCQLAQIGANSRWDTACRQGAGSKSFFSDPAKLHGNHQVVFCRSVAICMGCGAVCKHTARSLGRAECRLQAAGRATFRALQAGRPPPNLRTGWGGEVRAPVG